MTTASKKLEVRIATDYSAYNTSRIDGYSVGLYADDECVFYTDVSRREQADEIASTWRRKLGIGRQFKVTYSPGGASYVVTAENLMAASADANQNSPIGIKSIHVEEIE